MARAGGSSAAAGSPPYYGISLFLGRRFVSENTLRHSHGALRADVAVSTVPGRLPLSSNLEMWEYTGSLRYNIALGGLQPFVKAGYGRHVGAGLEFIPVRGVGGLDWGFRGDVSVYSHNLGLENKEGSFVVAQDAHVTRIHLGLGTTLSF